MQAPEPVAASEFHAGMTCPACQKAVAAGDLVRVCAACGAASHEPCWRISLGCRSYFCAPARRAERSGPAEIVISPEEAAAVPAERLI